MKKFDHPYTHITDLDNLANTANQILQNKWFQYANDNLLNEINKQIKITLDEKEFAAIACQVLKRVSDASNQGNSDIYNQAYETCQSIAEANRKSELFPIDLMAKLSDEIRVIQTEMEPDIPPNNNPLISKKKPVKSLNKQSAISIDLSTIIMIISLLLDLYLAIAAAIPDSQLNRIIEQNNELIAIEKEQLRLEQQQTEDIEEITNSLIDAIYFLNEQIDMPPQQPEILGNQTESINDPYIMQSQQ